MVLVLPGLITGRWRGILTTTTVAVLVEGPINSMNYYRVVESQTCIDEKCKFSII